MPCTTSRRSGRYRFHAMVLTAACTSFTWLPAQLSAQERACVINDDAFEEAAHQIRGPGLSKGDVLHDGDLAIRLTDVIEINGVDDLVTLDIKAPGFRQRWEVTPATLPKTVMICGREVTIDVFYRRQYGIHYWFKISSF